MFPGSEVIATDVCVPVSRLAGLIEQYKLDQEKVNSTIEGGWEEIGKLDYGTCWRREFSFHDVPSL